jgi:uncharacterized protein involved in exopolysaccharide biosynthesis
VSLSQVLYNLWRRSWIIALTFLFAILVAGGVLLFVPGRYDAVATASIDPGLIDPVTESATTSNAVIGLVQGNLMQGSSLKGVGKTDFWVGLGSDRLGSSLS